MAAARKPSDCMASAEMGRITEEHTAVAIEPVKKALRCIGKVRRLSHFGNEGLFGEPVGKWNTDRRSLARGAASGRFWINNHDNMLIINRLYQCELGVINLTEAPRSGARLLRGPEHSGSARFYNKPAFPFSPVRAARQG